MADEEIIEVEKQRDPSIAHRQSGVTPPQETDKFVGGEQGKVGIRDIGVHDLEGQVSDDFGDLTRANFNAKYPNINVINGSTIGPQTGPGIGPGPQDAGTQFKAASALATKAVTGGSLKLVEGANAWGEAFSELREKGIMPPGAGASFLRELRANNPNHPSVQAMVEKLQGSGVDWETYRQFAINSFEQAHGKSIENLELEMEKFKLDNPVSGALLDFVPMMLSSSPISIGTKGGQNIAKKILGQEVAETFGQKVIMGGLEGVGVAGADLVTRAAGETLGLGSEVGDLETEAIFGGASIGVDVFSESLGIPALRKIGQGVAFTGKKVGQVSRVLRREGKFENMKTRFKRWAAENVGELPPSLIEEAFEPRDIFQGLRDEAFLVKTIQGATRNAVKAIETVESNLSNARDKVFEFMDKGDLNFQSSKDLYDLRVKAIEEQLISNNAMSPKMKSALRESRQEFRGSMARRLVEARAAVPSATLVDNILGGIEKVSNIGTKFKGEALDVISALPEGSRLQISRSVRIGEEDFTFGSYLKSVRKKIGSERQKSPTRKKALEVVDFYEKLIKEEGNELGVIDISPGRARRMLDDIDSTITAIGFEKGGKNSEAGVAMANIRTIIDQNLKQFSPEYKAKMNQSAKFTRVAEQAKAKFGSTEEQAINSVAAAARGARSPNKVISDMSELLGQDGKEILEELQGLTQIKGTLDKTRQIDQFGSVIDKEKSLGKELRHASEEEAAALATETLEQKAKRRDQYKPFITDQMQMQTFRAGIDKLEKLTQRDSIGVVDAYISGWDNLKKRAGTKLGNISDQIPSEEDLLHLATLQQKFDRFDLKKNPVSKSNIAIWMGVSAVTIGGLTTIGSLASESSGRESAGAGIGAGVLSAIGLGATAYVRKWGAGPSREMLLKIAQSPNPPTIRDIESWSLPKGMKQELQQSLRSFWEKFAPKVSGVIAINPEMRESLTLMLDKSDLAPTERAKAQGMMNKRNEVTYDIVRKLILNGPARPEKIPLNKQRSIIDRADIRDKPKSLTIKREAD